MTTSIDTDGTATAGRYLISTVAVSSNTVDVAWADGHTSRFHFIWLRDNCPSDRSRAAGTSQRLVDSAAIRADIVPFLVEVVDGGKLRVIWTEEGESSVFDGRWLRDHCYSTVERERRRRRPRLWDASIAAAPPELNYTEISADEGRFRWLAMLVDYGFVVLRDVLTELGQVAAVADGIGYLRETNYGRIFDVVSVENPNHLAYTDRGLAVHTDNPYRDPVPGIQLLHCLQANPAGGKSILVDGFRVARELQKTAPADFELLSTTPRHFRFADEHTDMRHDTTLIHVDANADVVGVRFNSRAAATLSLPEDLVEPYYEAYRRFALLLYNEAFSYHFKLMPGDLVMFDNERILHGRTGFDSRSGRRHLQGVYIDKDEVSSRLRVLARQLGLNGGDPALPGGPRL